MSPRRARQSVGLVALGLLVQPPLVGEQAERFLATARIVAREPVGTGITRPDRLTLTDGVRTARAIWKTIDEYRPGVHREEGGRAQMGFRDSYRYEVAAYELDKLLGLGLVPPTVEREIDGEKGSLQIWVENAMTELERRRRGVLPPRPGAWAKRMAAFYLFRQLLYDVDTKNIQNVLYDREWNVYSIDHSRAFRPFPDPPALEHLLRFPRRALERLERLDRAAVEARLGPYLDRREVDALLRRRDRIVEHARRLVARWGESVVLFDEEDP